MSMIPFENEIDRLLTQAEALLQDDKPVEALGLLDRARKLQPNHSWTMLFRGVALGQLGQTEEAIVQLIAAADSSQEDIDIQVDAARHLSLLEQYQDAIICAERAVNLDDNDAGGHAIFGEILERMGRITDAIPHREQALLLEPTELDSRYYLAVNLCDLGQYEEAFSVAQPLFTEFSDDPDIIRLHGACLSYLGRHQEALGCWAELERLEGLSPNLLHNRASTLDVVGLRDEALQTINEAIALEPDLAMNYYTRGMIQEHRGDDAAAIQDYITVLSMDEDHLDAVVNLVELAVTVDVAPTVLEHVQHLLGFTPDAAKLLYAHGRLLMEMGELPESAQVIASAVRHEPALAIGWYTLTMLYGMMGDFELSVIASDHALRYFQDDAGLWFNRALALHDLKRLPEAMDCYDKAIILSPEDPLPWLQIGRLFLLDNDRPADARGALHEALMRQPDNQSTMWMLALSELRLGNSAEALTVLEGLLADDADHLWGRLVRAALFAQQGRMDMAYKDLCVAARQGYDTRLLLNEPLFEPLWTNPQFEEMLHGVPNVGESWSID